MEKKKTNVTQSSDDILPEVTKLSVVNSSKTKVHRHEKLLDRRTNYQENYGCERDLRATICSPIPSKLPDVNCEVNVLDIGNNTAFPHITVQKCDEKFPDIHSGCRKSSPPSYISISRSGSNSSLEIPSPVMERRTDGGREIAVLSPGNLKTAFSRSEGCLYMDLVKEQNDKLKKDVISANDKSLPRTSRSSLLATSHVRKTTRSVSPRITKRLPCTEIKFSPAKTK